MPHAASDDDVAIGRFVDLFAAIQQPDSLLFHSLIPITRRSQTVHLGAVGEGGLAGPPNIHRTQQGYEFHHDDSVTA